MTREFGEQVKTQVLYFSSQHKLDKGIYLDNGNIIYKNPEEIVIWDRYLSYAHVFALTDKIINSGYEQIVKNGSFDIDDANNINLNNINTLN